MENGEEVDPPDQLRYLYWREEIVASQIKEDPSAYGAHEDILVQIKAVNEKIMNLGNRGGSMVGEATLRDARNNPW